MVKTKLRAATLSDEQYHNIRLEIRKIRFGNVDGEDRGLIWMSLQQIKAFTAISYSFIRGCRKEKA